MSGAIGEGTSWLSWWQSLESALIFPAREGPGLEQLDAAAMRLPSSLPPPNLVVCPPVHTGPTGDMGVLSVLMVMKSPGAVGSEEATGRPHAAAVPPSGQGTRVSRASGLALRPLWRGEREALTKVATCSVRGSGRPCVGQEPH